MWSETVSSRFGWLITEFADQVDGITHAVVVSADGVLLTAAATLPRDRSEQLAAVAAGLLSLTHGAAWCFNAGEVRRAVVEMQGGTFLQMGIKDGSCLIALAAPDCDLGLVTYEMIRLVERIGAMLTPRQPGKRPESWRFVPW